MLPSTSDEEVLAHPGHAGELRPVGHLVERQPQPELAGRERRTASPAPDVGADVVDDVLVLGAVVLDQQQVVLAEHPGRHPAQQRADLGAGDRPARRAARLPMAGAAARPSWIPAGRGAAQQSPERRDVGVDPAGPVGDPGPGRPGEGSQPGGGGRPAPRPRPSAPRSRAGATPARGTTPASGSRPATRAATLAARSQAIGFGHRERSASPVLGRDDLDEVRRRGCR